MERTNTNHFLCRLNPNLIIVCILCFLGIKTYVVPGASLQTNKLRNIICQNSCR